MPIYGGSNVPTTEIFDVDDLRSPEKLKELIIRLDNKISDISKVVNSKVTGLRVQDEVATGELFYVNPTWDPAVNSTSPILRPVFSRTINFGVLPNTATKTVAHNVVFDTNCTMTRLYGTATNQAARTYIPIPYIDTTVANDHIALWADHTNVYVATKSNRSAYTLCTIVMEYLKQ